MGYKDGAHDGRESQFQNGFDCGYQQGFQNGFLLGKYNGIRSLAQQTTTTTTNNDEPSHANQSNDLILQRCSRGQCLLCINPTLINDSISDIVAKQCEHMNRIETTLKERYDHLKTKN